MEASRETEASSIGDVSSPTRIIDMVVRVADVERDVTCAVSRDATVGELRKALGPVHGRHHVLAVGGQAVGDTERVASLGLVDGATVELVAPGDQPIRSPSMAARSGVTVAVVGGIDAGRSSPLAADLVHGATVTVGSHPRADLCVDDPTVSGAHVDVCLARGGGISVRDRGSLNGTRVEGTPVRDDTRVVFGAVVALGATEIVVRAVRDDSALAAERGGPFNRPPRHRPPDPVAAVAVPDPPASRSRIGFDVIALLGPLAIGAVMVLVLGSMRYAVFALMGPLLLIVSQASQRRRAAKDSKSSGRRFRHELAQFIDALDAARSAERQRLETFAPDPAEIVRRAVVGSNRLWERRVGDVDDLMVRIGRGARPWQPPIDTERAAAHPDLIAAVTSASTIDRCPVEVDLRDDPVIGIVGDRSSALALARSIVIQAAVLHGPADLAIDVAVDAGAASLWRWATWLPHTRGGGGVSPTVRSGEAAAEAALEVLDEQAPRRHLLVVDSPVLLEGRGAPVRRLLSAPGVAGIVVATTADALPGCCAVVVSVDDLGDAEVRRPGAGLGVAQVVIAGSSIDVASSASRSLARWDDPELDDPASALPTDVRLGELLGSDASSAAAVAAVWAARDDGCATPIGIGPDGTAWFDLVADGPHALVGGTTGSGKSELLRSMIAGLASRYRPDDLVFVLVDYKGGSAFDVCSELPHVVGLVTDLDHQLGARALRSLEAELRLREARLRDSSAESMAAYRLAGSPAGPLPRLVVVIDEFATLAAELPEFLGALVGIAQRGRSLGVHLVLATQRPSGVVSADIRANTNLRIALRMQDSGDSTDVIDRRDAASIDRSIPGRAYLRAGPGDLVMAQTALATAQTDRARGAAVRVVPRRTGLESPGSGAAALPPSIGPNDLELVVRSCVEAASIVGVESPRRPWIEMLPSDVSVEMLDTTPDATTNEHEEPASAPVCGPPVTQRNGVIVALADDPDHQRRSVLLWDPDGGHLGVFGAVGSGTTNALEAVVRRLIANGTPEQCWVYVFDHDGSLAGLAGAPHVGAVVRADERERRVRLIRFLSRCLAERRSAPGRGSPERIVVAIDQLPTLLADLEGADGLEAQTELRRLLQEGPAFGISAVITAERPTAVPNPVLASVTERYLLRLADPMDAGAAGFRPQELPRGGPGRGVHVGTRLVVQFPDASTAPALPPPASGGAPSIRCLPDDVSLAAITRSSLRAGVLTLPIGVGEPDLVTRCFELRPGDHVLVAGAPRSGVSTVLRSMIRGVRQAGEAVVVVVADESSPLRGEAGLVDAMGTLAQLDAVLERAAREEHRQWVVVVDDAHRIPEATILERLERSRHCRLVIGGRADRLGSMFGHWSRGVRSGGTGLLLQPRLDVDGDLLGVRLPRTTPAPLIRGRGFLVAGGEAALLQAAHP